MPYDPNLRPDTDSRESFGFVDAEAWENGEDMEYKPFISFDEDVLNEWDA